MKKGMRRVIGFLLALALVITSGVLPQGASAKTKKVKLNKSKATIKVGKTVKLKVNNAPKKAKVKWSVNKKAVATVTKKGVVKGKKAGKAKVTAKVTYKNGKKKVTKKLKCTVTVKKAASSSTATPTPTASAQASASAAPVASASPLVVPTIDVPTIKRTEERINSETGEKETVTKEIISYDDGTVKKDVDSITLISEYMGQGINLGNTLEASLAATDRQTARDNIDVSAFETAWGAPVTTQEMIDGYKSYGFNTVRIPVAWSNMIDENDPEYKINDAFMNRVEEVVNYCLNDEMYVILNIHWDSGWWSQFGQSDEWRAKAHARYESFWTQISERFKDYSDRLIFESANEEFCDAFNHEIDEYGYRASTIETGTLTVDEQYELANELNQKFVDIVRASGGNNEYRHLLLAGFCTNFEKTCDDRFKMPTDPKNEGVNKLSVSVHYYTPWGYCGDGQTKTEWGTDAERQEMIEQFNLMRKFTDAGYGVMIGEYGVCVAQHNNIPDYIRAVTTRCRINKFLPVLWDTPGLYYNRKKCKMRYADIGELFNSLTDSNGDTTSV
ncbi:MAG: cellulase family glycosylhydrolase, partial [Lachnospiraceae bacterium]|nr:cellulase family glycosylhydrolase [Lachnospiraceae bacterium]